MLSKAISELEPKHSHFPNWQQGAPRYPCSLLHEWIQKMQALSTKAFPVISQVRMICFLSTASENENARSGNRNQIQKRRGRQRGDWQSDIVCLLGKMCLDLKGGL